MKNESERLFDEDDFDDDDVGLRKALLKELDITEESEERRKKEVHLKLKKRPSTKTDGVHSDTGVNNKKTRKGTSTRANSSGRDDENEKRD